MSPPPDRHRGPFRLAPDGWIALGIFLVTAAWFGLNLRSEPAFADESAYVAQSYFFTLYVGLEWNDWSWIEYHAYDLPPLPKYLIGAALATIGEAGPGRIAAGTWFDNIDALKIAPRLLEAARMPSVLMGGLGCVAIYAIGRMLGGRFSGLLAAGLLAINPLYRVHARRAMSDVIAESLILTTVAVGLWAWSRLISGRFSWRGGVGSGLAVGVLAGLAVLAKLNGGIALMTLAGWSILALILPGIGIGRRLAVLGFLTAAGLASALTFVGLNPYVTAHPTGPRPPRLMAPADPDEGPVERIRRVIEHRSEVSRLAALRFDDYALKGPFERAKVIATQGHGRFGPLGPRDYAWLEPHPRYDWALDRGALLWLPAVLAGAVWASVKGRQQFREGSPPTYWAVLIYWLVAAGTVTLFIPLAWDRYQLPIQAPACLLVAGGLSGLSRAIRPRKPDAGAVR